VRVLVVDDHRSTRESLALGFTRLGHTADVAASAADAVSRLQQQEYNWLICDVRMPGATGLDVAVAGRKQQPHLGVILMTASDVSDDERRLLDAVGGTLVIKPATVAALVQLFERESTVAPCPRKETHS
jgi:CheY-like chemotaxis protein